jgi:hypothetical protein
MPKNKRGNAPMKYVYRSIGISDVWAGEPVIVKFGASDSDMTVRMDIERRRGGQVVAQLIMLPGEAMAWSDRLRRAAKLTMAEAEVSVEDNVLAEDYEKQRAKE